tara:strand:- start:124 stop:312 length:189 start_codon:yes stop_codon:yes gene_type:complete
MPQKKFGPNNTVKSDGSMGKSKMARLNPEMQSPKGTPATLKKPSGKFPSTQKRTGSKRHNPS